MHQLMFHEDSTSVLAWVWVVEALARSYEVDLALLCELVLKTLQLSGDLGKEVREAVALRCLQSLFPPGDAEENVILSQCQPTIGFDSAENCESVVRRVLHKGFRTSASDLRKADQLKRNVQSFIELKKASLPRSTLEQLKDTILRGTDSLAASLKEISGLTAHNQCSQNVSLDGGDSAAKTSRLLENGTDGKAILAEANASGPGNWNQFQKGNLRDRSLLSSKRDATCVDSDNHVQGSNDLVDGGHLGKKRKLDTNRRVRPNRVLSVAVDVSKTSKLILERNMTRVDSEAHEMPDETLVDRPNRSVDNNNELSDWPGKFGCNSDVETVDSTSLQVGNFMFFLDKLHQEVLKDGLDEDNHNDEPKNDNDVPILNSSSPAAIQSRTLVKDEQNLRLIKANATSSDQLYGKNVSAEVRNDVGNHNQPATSSDNDGYHDGEADVALKKCSFLSSQYGVNEDCFTVTETEPNLCMKCKRNDSELLVCAATNCPIVVHESCLGCSAKFDDSGNFYCPFCAYSRAISEYDMAKKTASQAKKELSLFICTRSDYGQENCSKRSSSEGTHQSELNKDVDRRSEANGVANHGFETNNLQLRSPKDKLHCPSVPSAIIDTPIGGKSTGLTIEALHCSSCERPVSDMMVQDQLVEGTNEGLIREQISIDFDATEPSCGDRKNTHLSQKHAEVRKRKGSQKPQNSELQKADSYESISNSEDENEKTASSNYSLRHQARVNCYTYPVNIQLRRKKLAWTSEEIETLKEGIQKFADDDKHVPWKRILEYGSLVFQRGRTTVDLKDKWRNILRGESPRSN